MKWYWVLTVIICASAVWIGVSAAFYRQFFKRFYDVLFAAAALILLSPLMAVLTVLGAVFMKGNPFFMQYRPGRIDKKTGREHIFRLYKFRTMTNKTDAEGGLLPASQRRNKYGDFLRASSLDELPQLINVIIGDMSVIGPRPFLVRDLVFMSEEQRERHAIRPGLTGLAQVKGRNAVAWDKKFVYDRQYLRQISLGRDVCIAAQTLANLLEHADETGEGDMDFGDWLLYKGRITPETYQAKDSEAKAILASVKKDK